PRFFFSNRRRHTRWPRDWSSDVCSSDLLLFDRSLSHRLFPRPEWAAGAFCPTLPDFAAVCPALLVASGSMPARPCRYKRPSLNATGTSRRLTSRLDSDSATSRKARMTETRISTTALSGVAQAIGKSTECNLRLIPSVVRQGIGATARRAALIPIAALFAACPLRVSAATPDPVLEWIA